MCSAFYHICTYICKTSLYIYFIFIIIFPIVFFLCCLCFVWAIYFFSLYHKNDFIFFCTLKSLKQKKAQLIFISMKAINCLIHNKYIRLCNGFYIVKKNKKRKMFLKYLKKNALKGIVLYLGGIYLETTEFYFAWQYSIIFLFSLNLLIGFHSDLLRFLLFSYFFRLYFENTLWIDDPEGSESCVLIKLFSQQSLFVLIFANGKILQLVTHKVMGPRSCETFVFTQISLKLGSNRTLINLELRSNQAKKSLKFSS